jgi:phage terminase small subunit
MGPIVTIPEDVRRLVLWAQESEERARTGSPKLREVRRTAAKLDRKEAAKRIAWRKRTGRR